MADRRWIDPDGEEWASEFEYRVYLGFRLLGYDVRRCDEGDTLDYTSSIKRGRCLECQSSRVVQERRYTPDLFVSDLHAPGFERPGCFIEAKGYWRADKRNLLRQALRERKDVPMLFVFQADKRIRGAKSTYSTYIGRYFKHCGVAVYPWNRALKKPETLKKKLEIFKANILAFSGGEEK